MLNCCTNIVFNILYYSLFHNNEYILIKLFTTESIIMVIGSLNLEIISHKTSTLNSVRDHFTQNWEINSDDLL